MQENKNLILAIVLCLIVLFGWGRFAEYMGWVTPPQPPAEAPATPSQPEPAPRAALAPPRVFNPAPGREFSVSTPLYDAVFYSGGGVLRSFTLKKFRSGITPDSPLVNLVDQKTADVAPLGLVINGQPSWSYGQWSMEETGGVSAGEGQTASFALAGIADNLRLRREFEINGDNYLIREKLTVANSGDQARSVRVAYTQAMDQRQSTGQYDSIIVAWDENGSLDDESSAKTLESTGVQASGNIYWAGPMTSYFLAAIAPEKTDGSTMRGRLTGGVYRVSLEEEELVLRPGEEKELRAAYWIGPKDRKMLDAAPNQLAKSINLGFFSIIGKGLIWLLEFFHGFIHNWGVAIILLTCLIKAVFWPLTAKSYAAMEKMKELNPLMQAIKEKCKGNREEMNKEVMALYKTYKVNPMSGCVPMIIQLPVFFGLYQALLTSLALRHASFITYLPGTHVIWLADLSAKDPLYITPIVMGLSMFLQQRMSPPPADPTQQKVMLFLPLIFTVLFLNFPSGLVLYWLVNNILSIFQQWLHIRETKKRKQAKAGASAKAN